MENFTEQKNTLGLYDPQFEHDACGIGAVVDIKGRKSHQTVDDALSIVERLEHRAGKDAEGKTGDGVAFWFAPPPQTKTKQAPRHHAEVPGGLLLQYGGKRSLAVNSASGVG